MSLESESSDAGSSQSVSIGTTSSTTKRLLHFWQASTRISDDENAQDKNNAIHDQDAFNGNVDSKRIGSLWILLLLLFLVFANSEKQIVLQNYLPTTLFGLYILATLFIVICLVHGSFWSSNSSSTASTTRTSKTKRLLAFVGSCRWESLSLIVALAVRICLHFLFIRFEQCTKPGIEGTVPLVYAIWSHRQKLGHARKTTERGVLKAPGLGLDRTVFNGDVKFGILLAVPVWIASTMFSNPRSTVICESTLASWILSFQFIATALDICILTSLQACLQGAIRGGTSFVPAATMLFTAVSLVCAPFVLILCLLFKLVPGFQMLENLDAEYFYGLAWFAVIASGILLLVGHFIFYERITIAFMTFTGVFVATNIISALRNRVNLTISDSFLTVLAFGAVFYAYTRDKQVHSLQLGQPQHSSHRSGVVICALLLITTSMISLGVLSGLDDAASLQGHPIDNLMYAADDAHQAWAAQAKQSETLQEAVSNYQKRYNRPPPPNFHIWYNFALARNSDVIDDFDAIERDLAPFRALSPAELRSRIRQSTDDPFNEVGLIKVRNGTPIVDKKFEGHTWMMDVLVLQMEYFISSLPDMDIPFNINDESRVIVPHGEMEKLISKTSPAQASHAAKHWSTNTGTLLDEPVKHPADSSFENWSFRNNFKKYSTLACPPSSHASRLRSWIPSRLCVWCLQPHSVSHFVEDWKRANNPCHQPDFANIHGFYQGPGAYKVTRKLLPVFSASKPQGYADILYPSIWEWDDGQRTRYAPNKDYPSPDYANKSNTLFWRGPTNEGFSKFGEWRYFSRQRFVHMNMHSKQSFPIYLPDTQGSETYNREQLTRDQLLRHPSLKSNDLAFDARFTKYQNAWDANIEEEVFGPAEQVDFQAYWQHKFVMSLDEGSASKNFIPLIQSNSLPFRVTIFQEWFDDRLTAWKHFVPVDLRLHGLWSTLAYFAGGFGTTRSNEGLEAGEFIAESGRLWGSRTLRRDDMEIYLFRLLLEWGRLLDDNRDEVGFRV